MVTKYIREKENTLHVHSGRQHVILPGIHTPQGAGLLHERTTLRDRFNQVVFLW